MPVPVRANQPRWAGAVINRDCRPSGRATIAEPPILAGIRNFGMLQNGLDRRYLDGPLAQHLAPQIARDKLLEVPWVADYRVSLALAVRLNQDVQFGMTGLADRVEGLRCVDTSGWP